MHGLDHTYFQISQHLHVIYHAVQYTMKVQRSTPQHRQAGQIPHLNENEVDNLEAFILTSQKIHQLSYAQLAEALFSDDNVGAASIKYALNKQGFNWYTVIKKLFISPTNQCKHLTWAIDHLT